MNKKVEGKRHFVGGGILANARVAEGGIKGLAPPECRGPTALTPPLREAPVEAD